MSDQALINVDPGWQPPFQEPKLEGVLDCTIVRGSRRCAIEQVDLSTRNASEMLRKVATGANEENGRVRRWEKRAGRICEAGRIENNEFGLDARDPDVTKQGPYNLAAVIAGWCMG